MMKRIIMMLMVALCSLTAFSLDDYDARRAKSYTQEAEYYQRKADSYRREAQYYLRQAESYQRDAAYYTRKGDASRARDYNRKAERAMDNYKTQMRYASNAEERAADYLKKAARLLGH